MLQPLTSYEGRIPRYPFWAADNGAFTRKPGGFSATRFRAMLHRPELAQAREQCLFVVAPDRLVIRDDGTVLGDAKGTLEQFPEWAEEIRALGFPVALVAQNGLEGLLGSVPWDLVDALFIGGDDRWKLGKAAAHCVAAALARGKHAHMGRVNSYKRLARASAMYCDTADGTWLAYGPCVNLAELIAALELLNCGVQLELPHT